jgi:putative aldouronate transport system substrate-binding protein
MKKVKLWLLFTASLMLAAIAVSPVFAGGGTQEAAKGPAVNEAALLNPVGQLPLLKEKINLTMGVIRESMVIDLPTNYVTRQLEKDSNIHLEFVYYGSNAIEATQKLELQIMAGGDDLPDIISFNMDPVTVSYYGEQGMIIPLENYIQKSAHFMKPGIAELPYDPWRYVRSPNGHIYSLFEYRATYDGDAVGRMYVNTAWLKEVGLSMPETTKEFENMLRAFKNHRFNNDGTREYPFIDIKNNMSMPRFIGPLVAPFVYIGGSNRWFYREPNGTISPVFTTAKWREALTWIRSMVDEGLIDPLSFTQDAEQIKSIGNATKGYAWGASTYYPLNFMSPEDPRASTWALMGGLSLPGGGEPVVPFLDNMPYNIWNVTKNCKYPEAAFRLGDLLMSEKYSIMTRFGGEEGVDWRRPEPGDQSYFEGVTPILIPILSWGVPTNKHWGSTPPRVIPNRLTNGVAVKGQIRFVDLWNAEVSSKAMAYYHPENVIGTIVYSRSEIERIGEIRANVETYFLECYTRFLLRDMSLEQDWDKYLAELKAMGLDTYVEVARAAYARMK